MAPVGLWRWELLEAVVFGGSTRVLTLSYEYYFGNFGVGQAKTYLEAALHSLEAKAGTRGGQSVVGLDRCRPVDRVGPERTTRTS